MVVSVNGTLIQSYNICKRQTWLIAHQIVPDQENQYIEIGRLIDNESYGRERKSIHFENVVFDLIKSEEEDIIVGEVKKSSHAQDSARLQLAFYLQKLKKNGIKAKGVLMFPEERKRITVELTAELEDELNLVIQDTEQIITRETAPPFEKIGYCKNCGYKEFCFA